MKTLGLLLLAALLSACCCGSVLAQTVEIPTDRNADAAGIIAAARDTARWQQALFMNAPFEVTEARGGPWVLRQIDGPPLGTYIRITYRPTVGDRTRTFQAYYYAANTPRAGEPYRFVLVTDRSKEPTLQQARRVIDGSSPELPLPVVSFFSTVLAGTATVLRGRRNNPA